MKNVERLEGNGKRERVVKMICKGNNRIRIHRTDMPNGS
jgi:hypothetical protein